MPNEHHYQYEKWNPRGYKSCMAILNFSKTYGNEAVSTVALEVNSYKVTSIESMLKTKSYLLHNQHPVVNNSYVNGHENIRGSEYYSRTITIPTQEIK